MGCGGDGGVYIMIIGLYKFVVKSLGGYNRHVLSHFTSVTLRFSFVHPYKSHV